MSISLKKEPPENPINIQETPVTRWSPLERDKLFISRDKELIWKKYCGFLDLTTDEFMIMQKLLLMEQIELAMGSKLGRKIIGDQKPKNIYEFRKFVPLTQYSDYQPYLGQRDETVLVEKPTIWAHTSGHSGYIKWVPYSNHSLNALADDTIAAILLSSATKKGEVLGGEGSRVVLNLPPVPYITGIMGQVAQERVAYRAIPTLEESAKMEFQEKIEYGYKIALHTGIDYIASIAVVLAQVGESFSSMGRKGLMPSWHPLAVLRLLKAAIKSKLVGRPIMPKDIWKIKGLVCGGTDASIYREQIYRCWGVQPLDLYGSTEAGLIGMQGWNKKGMTLLPYRQFFEFIPEEEWQKSRENEAYEPSTVLTNELKEGHIYELVITNFHGGPFIRYRMGDLIKVTALKDDEMNVNLPQIEFFSRSDDIIDIAGFSRLDEKTIWKAVRNLNFPFTDWTARKEQKEGRSFIHIYVELLQDDHSEQEIEHLIDQQFIEMDNDYKDLRSFINKELIRVTLLKKGSFNRYLQMKQAAGVDLSHWKPPHMNPSDATLHDLIMW
jgi:hypothetical protein